MPEAPTRLPDVPAKRYFNLNEVSELCGVKPHVLRSWEHEFSQLKPLKRRGNRSLYQHHEVLLIRRIRELLYEQGHTISSARKLLQGRHSADAGPAPTTATLSPPIPTLPEQGDTGAPARADPAAAAAMAPSEAAAVAELAPTPHPGLLPLPHPEPPGTEAAAPLSPVPAPAPAWNPHTLRWLRKELQEIHDTLWL